MGTVFILLGVIFLVWWYFANKRGKASLTWPTVPGTVISSGLVQVRDSDNSVSTKAQVVYSYDVAGAAYKSTGIGVSGGKGRATAIVERYPVGAPVRVFYNPAKPASALLEPGTQGLRWMLIAGTIAVVIGLIIAGGSSGSSASAQDYHHQFGGGR